VKPSPFSSEGRGASLALRRICAIPALRALAIQLAAFLPTLGAVYLLARLGVRPTYLHAALLQGAFAALLTAKAGLARWWWPIQLAFAPAVLAAHALALPAPLFLAAFLFLLLLFWSTFRTQVPYYPSGPAVRTLAAGLLPPGPARAIDIGSGFGGLALALARARPEAAVEGIELAPLPWLVSRARAACAAHPARFTRGDYNALDFADYDLVYAYLSPAAMEALWRKAESEMRPGSLLASYEFLAPGRAPDQSPVPDGGKRTLHVWRF
jgi:SAM-dependent methyltransferase